MRSTDTSPLGHGGGGAREVHVDRNVEVVHV